MKNILYKLIIVICVATISSCSFLDIETKDVYLIQKYYSTKAELNSALNGVYAVYTESALYGSAISGRMGLWADLGYNNNSVDVKTVAENAVVATDSKITAYWRACYKGINRANLLISSINKPKDISDAERENILGQAMFLRAYYYFMLTSKFGDVPLRTQFMESATTSEMLLAQSPSKKIYEFIIKDMEAAALMVPTIEKVDCGGRISQSAVYGILARVCLQNGGFPNYEQGMYSKALLYSKKVIDTHAHSLNPSYQQIFINYMQDIYDKKESIWEIEFWGNNLGSYNSAAGQVGRELGVRNRSIDGEKGYCTGSVRVTEGHYNMYDQTDLRRDWNIADFYYLAEGEVVSWLKDNNWQKLAGKWRREYELLVPRSSTATPTNFPMLRYADVLLMFAEAYACDPAANIEYEGLAYECLNMVRRRGHGADANTANPAVDFSYQSDKNELLEEIRQERAKELAFEMLRKDDLVRWGIFYDQMKSIFVPAFTSSYYVYARRCFDNVQKRDVLWPIPSAEMSINGLLVQNAGW